MTLIKKQISKLMTGLFFFTFSASVFAQTNQSCNPAITESTPTKNFVLYDNGLVLDKTTGLMWKRCPEAMAWSNTDKKCTVLTDENGSFYTKANWKKALESVVALNNNTGFAGYQDWRLPNLKELLTIIERKCVHPAYNTTLFPNVYSDPNNVTGETERYLWSSTPAGTNQVWMVSENHGSIKKRNRDTSANLSSSVTGAIERVLLVRDAQGDTEKYLDGVSNFGK